MIEVLCPAGFTFLLARHLITKALWSAALDLVMTSPPDKIGDVFECGEPSVQHSIFELYPLLLERSHRDADDLLKYLVEVQAYTDESFIALVRNADMKHVLGFVLTYTSQVRQVYAGCGKVVLKDR